MIYPSPIPLAWQICTAIHEDENSYALTVKRNTVAVVSDGSAVLGLGDIGPKAAMPVMEGKAQLFGLCRCRRLAHLSRLQNQ